MIEGIIFDSDDTIFDTSRISAKNLPWALTRFKSKTEGSFDIPTPEQAIAVYAPTWCEWVKMIVPGIDIEEFSEFYDSVRQVLPHKYRPIPGALEAIAKTKLILKSQGVVTSGSKSGFLKKFSDSGKKPEDFIDFYFTLDNNPYIKPDPKAFGLAIDIMNEKGITKQNIYSVGDNRIDYDCALSAGIGFIGVLTGQGREYLYQLRQKGYTILPSIANLPAHIQSHNPTN